MASLRVLIFLLIIASVTGLSLPAPSVMAAEMTGVTETLTDDELKRERSIRAQILGGTSEETSIIHFSVLPSAEDPTIPETRVYVQKKGEQTVCITLDTDDVVTRSYRSSQQDPFAPTIPSLITTDSSGYRGDLIGFNDQKVFIRPKSSADLFTSNECFTVDGNRGCLTEDALQCDQELDEEQEVCVSTALGLGSCTRGDHAGLIDELKKLLAANEEGPLETAAGPLAGEAAPEDVLDAPEVSQVFDDGGPSPPSIGDVVNTVQNIGGGDDLVEVPSIIGLTEAEARVRLEQALLRAGTFTTVSVLESDQAWFQPIKRAYAQANACTAETNDLIIDQDPSAGSFAAVNARVNGVRCAFTADMPEPSSIAIFVVGLAIVMGLYMWIRRRERPSASL